MRVTFSDEAFTATGGKINRLFGTGTAAQPAPTHPVGQEINAPAGTGKVYCNVSETDLVSLHHQEIQHDSGATHVIVTKMNDGEIRASLGFA